jgi:hypothetical protein
MRESRSFPDGTDEAAADKIKTGHLLWQMPGFAFKAVCFEWIGQ